MTATRLLLRSALLTLAISLGVVLAVTYQRIVREHWYVAAFATGVTATLYVATGGHRP